MGLRKATSNATSEASYAPVSQPLPVAEGHKHWEVNCFNDRVPELQLPYLC